MTTVSVDTAAVRASGGELRAVGGQTMGMVAATPSPSISAAEAGSHAGVAAAIGDLFDAWLDSVGRGGETIERLGRVVEDAAGTYGRVDAQIGAGAGGGGRQLPI